MTLYRAAAGDGVAWITGASSGIGRELALQLARRGFLVAATARNAEALESLASEAEGLMGAIRPFACDVTDRAAMALAVAEIELLMGPIRLAIFNAGTYLPTPGEAIDLDVFEKIVDVNLFGALHGLRPAVERMKAHGLGHVVIVASASAYRGLPSAAAYGASKSALISMAESLAFDFEKMNIRIQVVNPGFVETPLTGKNDFAMPALVPVEKAVSEIVLGMEEGGFEVSFPRRLIWQLKFLRLLPYPLYFAIMRRATGWAKRPLDFGGTTRSSAQSVPR